MNNILKHVEIYQYFVVILIAVIASFLILNASQKMFILIAGILSIPFFVSTILFSIKKLSLIINAVKIIHISWIFLLISSVLLKSRTATEIAENPVQSQQWLRIIPVLIAGCFAGVYLLRTKKISLIFQGPLLFFLFYCVSSLISIS